MRNLADMRFQVRRLLNDVRGDVWKDPALNQALEDGVKLLAFDLVSDPHGRVRLRAHSTAATLQAGTEEYSLPGDCLKVEEAQFRESSSATRWRSAQYRPPQPGKTPPPLFWFDDLGDNQIRIWPEYATIDSEQWRVAYFRMPQFPQTDDATFNDPYGDGSDTYDYSEMFAMAVEYRGALNAAEEEQLNNVPLEYLQQMYRRYLQTLIQGVPMAWPDRQYTMMYSRNNEEEDS